MLCSSATASLLSGAPGTVLVHSFMYSIGNANVLCLNKAALQEFGLSKLPPMKEAAQIQAIRSQIGKDLITARNQIKTVVSIVQYLNTVSHILFGSLHIPLEMVTRRKGRILGH